MENKSIEFAKSINDKVGTQPVVKKEKKLTVASCVEEVLHIGCKNKTACIESIRNLLAKAGLTKTKNGNKIDEALIARRLACCLSDVGKGKGIWKKYKFINKENEFKIYLKA